MRFIYLFLCLSYLVKGQSIVPDAKGWQDLTITDGLSQGMIFDIQQDQKGFLWIATKDGLNRYDGYNFNVFIHDVYNDFSLSDNSCTALLIDRKNRLWIGTMDKGLNLYDQQAQRFYHITISDPSLPNGNNYEISCLAEDPDGNIWVGTSVGRPIKVVLPPTLKQGFPQQADFTNQVTVVPLTLNNDHWKWANFSFSFRPDGLALTGQEAGLYQFNWRNPKKLEPYTLINSQKEPLFDFYDEPSSGFTAYSSGHQLHCWLKGLHKVIDVDRTNNSGIAVRYFDANNVLLATSKYLWIMSPEELMAQENLNAGNAYVQLPAGTFSITRTLKDKTGNIWIGTNGYGLRKFNPLVKKFRAYLPGTSLGNLFIDQQKRIYARMQLAYEQLDLPDNRHLPFLDPRLPPTDLRQRHLFQDRKGIFWASNTNYKTHTHQLIKFSTTWQLQKKYSLPRDVSFGFTGNKTIEDTNGSLWLGAINGKLLQFNPITEQFRVLSYQSLLLQKGADVETYAMLPEPDGSLWIGTQQGLVKATQLYTEPTFKIFKNDRRNRSSLSNDFVLSLAHDPLEPERFLWVGTKGGGLERLDIQTGRFTHFTKAQGLPNMVVYGMLADEFNNLWLSTNRGLSQFNLRTFLFRNYTKADGLQDDEFNTSSYLKTAGGELMFGGVNGLTVFRAADLVQAVRTIPAVAIIGLRVNNKPVRVGSPDEILTKSIENSTSLQLAHNQNLLTFEFGVMDYTNVGNNRFRYRLEGIDDEWVEAGTSHFANYAQLPDGHYRLQVMGSVDGEHWSRPVTLEVRVQPPFYRTWWAYLIYISIIGYMIWQYNRFQRGRLLLQQQVAFEQREASRLAEMDAFKSRFFTNISHEFRTPLTLILGPLSDRVNKPPTDVELSMMERNGNRLLRLINQLLELSKLDAGELKISVTYVNVVQYFQTLMSSFASLAESRQITFSVTQNQPDVWGYLDTDKTEKITTNLLSNAFKFTPPTGTVRVEINYGTENQQVSLKISDTGIGINAEKLGQIFNRFYQVESDQERVYEGTGIGLSLVKELVIALNGTIRVESREGAGTVFFIELPIGNRASEDYAAVSKHEWALTESTIEHTPAEEKNPVDLSENENLLLIIDDNADIRAYVRQLFENEFQIIEATDGGEGLAQAIAFVPTIIICDLMMPHMDGFTFCQALRTNEKVSHIPVIMLTAKATIESRIKGFELGADEYLVKPFNTAEIKARVRNLLEKQEKLRQFFTGRPVDGQQGDVRVRSMDEAFLEKVTALMEQQLANTDFGVLAFAEAMNMSKSQLNRKLKALTGHSPNELLRIFRLQRAAELLRQQAGTVSEIAYQVGFSHLSYFASSFQEQYGKLPSQYP